MLAHCTIVLVLAAALRPCGSSAGNAFLIEAKFCGALVGLLIVLHTATSYDAFTTSATVVTTTFAFLSTVQAICQLVTAAVLGSLSVIPAIRLALKRWKNTSEDMAVNSGGITMPNLRDACEIDDELMRNVFVHVEDMDEGLLFDMLLNGKIPSVDTTLASLSRTEHGEVIQ